MKDVDKELELIATKKLYHDEMLEKAKIIISDCILKNDFSEAVDLPKLYDKDNFVLDAEFNRINIILSIYMQEMAEQDRPYFFENTGNYKGLFEKYIKTVMMLRRLEMDFDESFVDEAYENLKGISPEAIIIILDSELYEHKQEIAVKLYRRLYERENLIIRIKWLSVLYKRFRDQWMLDEANSLIVR